MALRPWSSALTSRRPLFSVPAKIPLATSATYLHGEDNRGAQKYESLRSQHVESREPARRLLERLRKGVSAGGMCVRASDDCT